MTTPNNPLKLYYALKFVAVDPTDVTPAVRELQNLSETPQHSAIVDYYGWLVFARTWIVFAMELCQGTLTKFLRSEYFLNLPENKQRPLRWEILVQIADGLAACHYRGIMHRDMKPDNSTRLSNL